jgi:hypothetical protein
MNNTKFKEILTHFHDVEFENMNTEIIKCIMAYHQKMIDELIENNIDKEMQNEYLPIELLYANAHGNLFEKLYNGDKEIGNAILANYSKMVNK